MPSKVLIPWNLQIEISSLQKRMNITNFNQFINTALDILWEITQEEKAGLILALMDNRTNKIETNIDIHTSSDRYDKARSKKSQADQPSPGVNPRNVQLSDETQSKFREIGTYLHIPPEEVVFRAMAICKIITDSVLDESKRPVFWNQSNKFKFAFTHLVDKITIASQKSK